MTIQPLADDLTLINLDGRLDIAGAEAIDDQFSFATATRPKRIIVDLAQVDFLASIGVRILFTAARAQSARGGRIALAQPSPMVHKVLTTAGVDQMIPIFDTVDAARSALESA
jgi:anti-anti-sigma factor